MAFDLALWREEVQQTVNDFARDPKLAMAAAGVNTVYGFLLGSTMLPVVAAYATDPKSTIAALIGVAGSLGANLIANLAQRKYDNVNIITVAAEEAQNTDLASAYEVIAQQVEIFRIAEEALSQARQTDILAQLRDELHQLGLASSLAGATINIHQSGGINFGVNTNINEMGDVIAGDKVVENKLKRKDAKPDGKSQG
jgi:hypothetical protein